MTVRTIQKTAVFKSPFVLTSLDEVFPAGTYCVEMDEELLENISFPAYRRIRTVIRLQAEPGRPGVSRILTIDADELDEAIERDRVSSDTAPEPSSAKNTV